MFVASTPREPYGYVRGYVLGGVVLHTILIAFAGGSGAIAMLNYRETGRWRTKDNARDVQLYRRMTVLWGSLCLAAVIGASV